MVWFLLVYELEASLFCAVKEGFFILSFYYFVSRDHKLRQNECAVPNQTEVTARHILDIYLFICNIRFPHNFEFTGGKKNYQHEVLDYAQIKSFSQRALNKTKEGTFIFKPRWNQMALAHSGGVIQFNNINIANSFRKTFS